MALSEMVRGKKCKWCKETDALFTRQRKRVDKAARLWQKAHNCPGIHPDLGELVGWILSENRKLKKLLYQVGGRGWNFPLER